MKPCLFLFGSESRGSERIVPSLCVYVLGRASSRFHRVGQSVRDRGG